MQLLAVSFLARIHLCRNFALVVQRHRPIFVMQQVLRGPINYTVSIEHSYSTSTLSPYSDSDRGLLRRKPLRPSQPPKPKPTSFSSLVAVAFAVWSDMTCETATELLISMRTCRGSRRVTMTDVVVGKKMRKPRCGNRGQSEP